MRGQTHTFDKDGISYRRSTFETPAGTLSTLRRSTSSTEHMTSWAVDHIFKTKEDYKALLFMIEDERCEPCYADFTRAQDMLGEDVILRAGIGATPLHQIMVQYMGVETFAIEWVERRDEIDKLVNATVANLRQKYKLVAESPVLHANYGGNETAEMMGRQRFEEYVLPHHNEAAEVMHKYGKYVGAHMDGNNKVWADLLAGSRLDYIEAFTPAPDTDLTIEEALDTWSDKALWINFPSSVFLKPPEEVEAVARQIIDAGKGRRLIIGITENIPPDRWQDGLLAISRAVNQ